MSEASSPLDGSAVDLAKDIRDGKMSPVEAMELTLDRIDERNPALNAVIWCDREQALIWSRQALGQGNTPG